MQYVRQLDKPKQTYVKFSLAGEGATQIGQEWRVIAIVHERSDLNSKNNLSCK